MPTIYEQIQQNYAKVQDQIKSTCQACQRDPASVKLVVVTKKQPVDKIQAVITAGARYLGENYAEEAVGKMEALEKVFPGEWHIIGHIQSRKVSLVADHFQMIHSLDSLKLALKLNEHLSAHGKTMPVLLEVNIANEESKTGWRVEGQDWKQFLLDLEAIQRLPSIQIRGLMAMPPLTSNPLQARGYFQQTYRILEQINGEYNLDLTELSMGTSSDYILAIEEGATMVRIGQLIMGPRNS